MKDVVIERIGFRLNEKKTKNKWTDERNDAHIGEVRVKISVRDEVIWVGSSSIGMI